MSPPSVSAVENFPFQDSALLLRTRVGDLLERLTLLTDTGTRPGSEVVQAQPSPPDHVSALIGQS